MYAKIINNEVVKYPYSVNELKQDNPDTSFPMSMTDEGLAGWGVYPVAEVPCPKVDYTKNVVEETPNLINGEWYQDWSVTAKPQAEIDAIATSLRAEAYREESDPLFFKWQRGESTEQEWLDKIAEIKARYPKD